MDFSLDRQADGSWRFPPCRPRLPPNQVDMARRSEDDAAAPPRRRQRRRRSLANEALAAIVAALLLAEASRPAGVAAHPLCTDFTGPGPQDPTTFCNAFEPAYGDNGCCAPSMDQSLQTQFDGLSFGGPPGANVTGCRRLVQKNLCA
eukprot:SM003480S12978  [mRNA]  locus=s3480:87:841:+ [translate_table: standard]